MTPGKETVGGAVVSDAAISLSVVDADGIGGTGGAGGTGSVGTGSGLVEFSATMGAGAGAGGSGMGGAAGKGSGSGFASGFASIFGSGRGAGAGGSDVLTGMISIFGCAAGSGSGGSGGGDGVSGSFLVTGSAGSFLSGSGFSFSSCLVLSSLGSLAVTSAAAISCFFSEASGDFVFGSSWGDSATFFGGASSLGEDLEEESGAAGAATGFVLAVAGSRYHHCLISAQWVIINKSTIRNIPMAVIHIQNSRRRRLLPGKSSKCISPMPRPATP